VASAPLFNDKSLGTPRLFRLFLSILNSFLSRSSFVSNKR